MRVAIFGSPALPALALCAAAAQAAGAQVAWRSPKYFNPSTGHTGGPADVILIPDGAPQGSAIAAHFEARGVPVVTVLPPVTAAEAARIVAPFVDAPAAAAPTPESVAVGAAGVAAGDPEGAAEAPSPQGALAGQPYPALQALARERGIPANQSKAALVAALAAPAPEVADQ